MFGGKTFDFYARPDRKRAAQAKAERLALRLKHRREVCDRYGINVATYEERFARWRYMRELLTRAQAQEKARADREAITFASAERRAERISRNAARETENVLDGLRARFPADLSRID